MIGLLELVARPLLRMLDPEDAHRLAIQALKFPPFVKLAADDPRLAVRAFGLNFPNPIGQRSTRHKSGLAMRFPRINRLRWDKPPGEADRLETLERMLEKIEVGRGTAAASSAM